MVDVGMCSCGHSMGAHDPYGCLICKGHFTCGKETTFPELMADDPGSSASFTPAGAGSVAGRLPPSVLGDVRADVPGVKPAKAGSCDPAPASSMPVERAVSPTEDSAQVRESSGPARLAPRSKSQQRRFAAQGLIPAPIDPQGFAYFAWVCAVDPDEWREGELTSEAQIFYRSLWELGWR